MIDSKLILEKPKLVEDNNRKRGVDLDVKKTQSLLARRQELLQNLEALRAQANLLAKEQGDQEQKRAKGKALKEDVKKAEAELADTDARTDALLRSFPNLLRQDVPVGAGEVDNEVVKTVGKPPGIKAPKDHLQIGETLGLIDMERAANVSGARFAYLKGDLVLLEFAIVQHALSILLKEGFVPVFPPHLISTHAMGTMGYLEHGAEDEIYHMRQDDLVLIGTGEQAIGPMYMNEILEEADLPLRYAAYSPCYRREAGSHGKDVRGMLRVHQFNKLEMFSFTAPESSDREHEFLLSLQEKLMGGLGLPYRVVKLCSADTGAPSARTYDIETWLPSQQKYRETHSTSNTTDFQTRRLKVRMRDKNGGKQLVHALNGTAFAQRLLIAILENFQCSDGSVEIPKALRKLMGKKKLS